MVTRVEGVSVAKAKGRPKRSERDDVTVKVDRRLVGIAKQVATYQGVSVAELLSGILQAPIERAYGQMLREIEAKG